MKDVKITNNLIDTMKGFKGRDNLQVKTLSDELGRTEASIRSTLSVNSYKKYFIKDIKFKDDKKVITYSLSQEGKDLLASLKESD